MAIERRSNCGSRFDIKNMHTVFYIIVDDSNTSAVAAEHAKKAHASGEFARLHGPCGGIDNSYFRISIGDYDASSVRSKRHMFERLSAHAEELEDGVRFLQRGDESGPRFERRRIRCARLRCEDGLASQ
jgi:hypothetical protein